MSEGKHTGHTPLVRVKPLEWHAEPDYGLGWWHAINERLRLVYEVRVNGRSGTRIRLPGDTWQAFDGSSDEAKAAAQVDYERRILSAIEPCPSLPILVEALEAFADPANWVVNGRFDPHSGNFDATSFARAVLASIKGGDNV